MAAVLQLLCSEELPLKSDRSHQETARVRSGTRSWRPTGRCACLKSREITEQGTGDISITVTKIHAGRTRQSAFIPNERNAGIDL